MDDEDAKNANNSNDDVDGDDVSETYSPDHFLEALRQDAIAQLEVQKRLGNSLSVYGERVRVNMAHWPDKDPALLQLDLGSGSYEKVKLQSLLRFFAFEVDCPETGTS